MFLIDAVVISLLKQGIERYVVRTEFYLFDDTLHFASFLALEEGNKALCC